MPNTDDRAFFVGYLSMPKSLAWRYRLIIIVLLLLAVGAAVILSSSQKSAGNGTWNAFEPVTVNGILALEPYPVLHVAEPLKRSILIVQLGKLSADSAIAAHIGKQVSVTGFPIARGNWHMLEIEDAAAITPITSTPPDKATEQSLGNITITGEIVDSKCFLGVMRPGAGRVHRACATLCLKGGLPPVLVVQTPSGHKQGFVLTQSDGSSASQAVAAMAAIPVEVSGELIQRGELLYLRMINNGPSRLIGSAREAYGDSLAMTLASTPIVSQAHCLH